MEVVRLLPDDFLRECEHLFDLHYEDSPRVGREGEKTIAIDAYKDLHELGLLLILAAYEGDEVVGYIVGIIHENLHHKGDLTLRTAAFYIRREHRRKGYMKELFGAFAQYAKLCGVYNVEYIVNESYPESHKLMETLGLVKLETTYTFDLGDK